MNKIKTFIDHANINRFRTGVQLLAFVLLLFGGYFALDFGTHIPAFSCPFAEGSSGTCYLYPLQHQSSLSFAQLMGGRGVALLSGLGIFVLFFVVFNKSWCGFICPLGTLQDWITRLRTGLGIRYSSYRDGTFKKVGKIKYVLLLLLVLLPLGMKNSIPGMPTLSANFETPYCMICPGRTVLPVFSGDTSQLSLDFSSGTKLALTTLGMMITGLFLIGSFFKRRFFCILCPMSALQYLFSKIGLLRLSKNGSKCTRCGNCSRVCDMGIQEIAEDVESRNIVQDDCMMCFKCVAACPENECLRVHFLGLPLYTATEEGFYKRTIKE